MFSLVVLFSEENMQQNELGLHGKTDAVTSSQTAGWKNSATESWLTARFPWEHTTAKKLRQE
jgi:kynureninase